MITIATNLSKNAAGQLFNHDFTEYAEVGGICLGVKEEDGVYLVCSGDADVIDETEIDISAYFRIAAEDFGISNLKKIRSIYMQYESDGNVIVTLIPDEGTEQSYLLTSNKTGQQRKRKRVKSRPRGCYWEIQIENSEGSDIGIDVFECVIQILNQGFI